MEVTVGQASYRDEAWNEAQNESRQGRTFAIFYDREVQNNFETEKQGRPIFITRTFVRKVTPGDRLMEIDRPAKAHDFSAFPQAYAAYKNKQASPISGTPLEAWPQLTRSQVAEFKAINVFTLEQLVGLSDAAGQNIMGFHKLKASAMTFLRAASDGAYAQKLEDQLKVRDQAIEQLQLRLEAMEKAQAAQHATVNPDKVVTRGENAPSARSSGNR